MDRIPWWPFYKGSCSVHGYHKYFSFVFLLQLLVYLRLNWYVFFSVQFQETGLDVFRSILLARLNYGSLLLYLDNICLSVPFTSTRGIVRPSVDVSTDSSCFNTKASHELAVPLDRFSYRLIYCWKSVFGWRLIKESIVRWKLKSSMKDQINILSQSPCFVTYKPVWKVPEFGKVSLICPSLQTEITIAKWSTQWRYN